MGFRSLAFFLKFTPLEVEGGMVEGWTLEYAPMLFSRVQYTYRARSINAKYDKNRTQKHE
jgi:hypothetical protein